LIGDTSIPNHWSGRSDLAFTLGTEKEELYYLATAFTKTTAHVAAKIAPPEDAHQREAGEMSPGR
jgi:hypothetical protein